MTQVIGLDDLVSNALIELIKNEKDTQISYKTAIEYGYAIIQKLKEKGLEAMLLLGRDQTAEFEYLKSETFIFFDKEGMRYAALSPNKSVQDLRENFRAYLGLDKLLAFTDLECLKILGIDERIDNKIDNRELGTIVKANCVYEYQKNTSDNYHWNGYMYLSDSPLKNRLEGISVDKSDSVINNKINERYIIGKKDDKCLDFTVFPGNINPLDYSLLYSLEDRCYFGQWNYVDFYNKNIKFGGLARVELEYLEDLKIRRELLEKIEQWNSNNTDEDYSVMITELLGCNKGKLEDTFINHTSEQAKRLFLVKK